MTRPNSAFARDPATAQYYDRRAAEYDDWYRGHGRFATRHRPGWREEVDAVVAWVGELPAARTLEIDGQVLLDGDWFIAARAPATPSRRS